MTHSTKQQMCKGHTTLASHDRCPVHKDDPIVSNNLDHPTSNQQAFALLLDNFRAVLHEANVAPCAPNTVVATQRDRRIENARFAIEEVFASLTTRVAQAEAELADLRQFREWAEPQVATHGKDSLEIERLHAALKGIEEYQGHYATDKNPTVRALKRLASEALSGDSSAPERIEPLVVDARLALSWRTYNHNKGFISPEIYEVVRQAYIAAWHAGFAEPRPSAVETKTQSIFDRYPEGTLFQKQGTEIVAMLKDGTCVADRLAHELGMCSAQETSAPLAAGCHRSHPHEDMSPECERLADIAREHHQAAHKAEPHCEHGIPLNSPSACPSCFADRVSLTASANELCKCMYCCCLKQGGKLGQGYECRIKKTGSFVQNGTKDPL